MVIDKDDVYKSLEEFIALHGITKLVMGAAADKHYSKYGLHIPDDCSLFIMLPVLLKLQDIKMIKEYIIRTQVHVLNFSVCWK
jgi:hypothetical protein